MATDLIDNHEAAIATPSRGEQARMRICHVSLTLCTGALERLLADWARFHNSEKFQLSYIAMQQTGRFADEIREHGCPVTELRSKKRFGQIMEMAKIFRADKIDVVHTHNTYPHIYATLAARLAGVKAVVNTRHGQRLGHGKRSQIQYRWASRFVNRMVAVSEDAARLCVDDDGVAESRVSTIWNGIDLSKFGYRGPSTAPTAISVARLSPEKDFPTMLKATAEVVKKIPDFRLQIVGDGSERESMEALVQQLGISTAVEFLGERTDVHELLGKAGFYVSSSLSEGISLTLLEAMAVGLPIVATDVGGNSEIVVDGETGHVVPANDPSALATAIIGMCHKSEQWSPMGVAGRKRVETCFDIRRMIADYEHVYEEVATKR